MTTKPERENPLFHSVHSKKDEVGEKVSEQYEVHDEKRILKFSIYAALFFAVLALVWGSLIKSQMLIFDGIYAFASVVMASLSVYVSKMMESGDDVKFPFGKSQMEPMVIILKALVIIVICISAFGRAAVSIFSGGRDINTLSAATYSLVGIIGCLGCWFYIKRSRKKASASDLVKLESMQWLADALLSVAIFIGFLAAYSIGHTEYARFSRYVDPLMVIVAALFFSVVPIKSLIRGVKDILQMTPDGEVYKISRRIIEDVSKKRGFDGFVLRIVKSGREFVYEIGFVSDNLDDERSMGELDSIRLEVERELKSFYDNPIWVDISFMHDKKWG